MLGLTLTLIVARFQTGALNIGPAHVRILAIGDFTRAGSAVWDATGHLLTPTEAKAIKALPHRPKLGIVAETLRNKTDLGRFVVMNIDSPKEWRVIEEGLGDKLLASDFSRSY